MIRMARFPLSLAVGVWAILLLLSIITYSQTTQRAAFSNIKIKNFGQMDERFFRGAQPKKDDYKELAALGIKTVIDLRADPKDYAKPTVESLGMRYINIPMIEKKYPRQGQAELFLKIANDPETGKFYVHCAGGRHRTGVMGAVYRFTRYGWNYDQVYREMKDYDFYTRWGHGDFKRFVEDYWQHMQAGGHATASRSTISQGNH